MKEKLYKCLKKNRVSPYAGFQWPRQKWVKVDGELVECENGVHLCREKDIIYWLSAQTWEVEAGGERVDCKEKIIVREARLVKRLHTWDARTARLFTCDCAEHVLPTYEKEFPNDKRPRKVVETARRYTMGRASKKEIEDAAQGATWATTLAAALVAAAQDAARTATWAVAWVATRRAERKWQTERLLSYLYPEGDQG